MASTAGRAALDDATVNIDRGEFVFLVGASGSDKSSFLRLCLKEERANTRTVHVAGRDLATLASWKVPASAAAPTAPHPRLSTTS